MNKNTCKKQIQTVIIRWGRHGRTCTNCSGVSEVALLRGLAGLEGDKHQVDQLQLDPTLRTGCVKHDVSLLR